MTAAIDIDHLTKRFGEHTAVDDLSLSIPHGQVTAFLGPNGAGKTTTIKMTCGLIKPTSGTVRVNGFDVREQRAQAMRQIGVVLEGARNVYWRLTAWDNILYFGRLKGAAGKALRARGESLLREFDLWDRRHDEAGDFSRGMQQKLAIACALIADPPVILLDEPTLGLDVQAARAIKQQIQDLSQTAGKTILVTTHDLNMAQSICERIAIIRNGKLIANQPTHELLSLFQRDYYAVTVASATLPPALTRGLQCEVDSGQTRLFPLPDQEALYRLLDGLRQHDLTLVSVEQVQPTLEDIFVQLTD